MKTRIFKIINMLAVSLFLSAGISLAQTKSSRQPKSQANAYGYHHDQDQHGHHPGGQNGKHKSYRPKNRDHNYYHRYYYHKYRRGYKRPYPIRPFGWTLHDCDSHGFIFGMSFNDPYMSVVIGANDR